MSLSLSATSDAAVAASPPVRRAGLWQAWVVIFIGQLPVMAIVSLMPALPTLARHFAGVPHGELLIPLILTVPGLGIGLLAPFAGYFVDKFGRRKLLLVFMVLYGVGGILPFFLDGFSTVLASRLLLGVGECFVLVVGNTLLGDYFPPEQRAKWLTIQGVFGPVTGIFLLAMSGRLAAIGWNYPFLVYGLALVLAVLVWLHIFEPARPTPLADENQPAGQFPLGTVLTVFGVTLLIALLYYVHIINFSLALDAMGVRDQVEVGNVSALVSVGVPLGALLYRLVARQPFWQQLAIMGVLIGAGLYGVGSSHSASGAIATGLSEQVGCGMTIPALIGWALRTLPVAYRGRGMGFWTSALFLGQFLNPFFMQGLRAVSGGDLLTVFRVCGLLGLGLGVGVGAYALLAGKPRSAVAA